MGFVSGPSFRSRIFCLDAFHPFFDNLPLCCVVYRDATTRELNTSAGVAQR